MKAEAECQIRPDPSGPVSTRKFLDIARGRPAMSRIPLHGLQRGKDTELDLEKLDGYRTMNGPWDVDPGS